LCMP
ncbi:cutC family protein, partial [Vibrio parahaemolyticus EKP-021]